jgi:hypothetical protein
MVAVPDVPDNVKQCICLGCPTFKGSKLMGILFCAKGKAKETVNQQGCDCPKCPVWAKYGLKDQYFCSNGKAV